MDDALLEIQGLSAGYGPIEVLNSIDLSVHKGSMTAILGPNGAGKSTLFRAILGLVRVSAGSVVYEGSEITHTDTVRQSRAGLGLVPEGRGLFPPMTVRENLLLGGFTHRRDRAGIRSGMEEVVELFPILGSRMKQTVSSLSGGQQQMVAIGRALMGRPKVLLLDEPSLGLAPIVFQQVVTTLQALRQSGRTILLAEQNVRTAVKYADHVYLMRNGTVVSNGDAAQFADLGEHGIGYLAGDYGV